MEGKCTGFDFEFGGEDLERDGWGTCGYRLQSSRGVWGHAPQENV